MGKFKKGDFVRRVKPSDWPTQYGVIDGVYEVLEERQYGIVVIPGGSDAEPSSFEPWQPSVGERVRVTGNEQWKGDGEVTELRNYGIFIVSMKTGQFADKTGGFYLRDIEPILSTTAPEQPAPLTIEAGKFYKTRDGRKVGPIVVAQGRGNPWPWKSRYGLNIYFFKEDGFSCPGSAHLHRDADDIVAEWIDEPVTESSTTTAGNDNTQPKFKAGDRVKCLKSYPGQFTAGKEYVVSADHFGREYESVKVKVDDAGSTENGWLPEFFELVTPTTTIVALIENGQPKPSSIPHVHTSTGAAEKEAKRLAAKHKGQQFGVFTLTTTHHEPKPVYDHKWQNMAALGLKIDAIRELRSITGMGLKPAKDAVEYFLAAA